VRDDVLQRIKDGRTDLVFEWVAVGGSATAKDEHDVPLCRWCAYYGDVSGIRYLLANGESLAALGYNLGLNEAAYHGHWPLVQFLLEQNADANAPHVDTGETPLHAALCKANRPQYDSIVELLLAYGANPNVATRPDTETGAFMRDCRTKGETPLHRAAAFGSEEAIRLLLEAGAVVDAKDMNGDTPLSWASWHLRPDAILRKLCYGSFFVHPERRSTYDHGAGWGSMGVGRPHTPSGR
jgi:hypothetical protein